MRENGLTANTFKPVSLLYDSDSSEVEVIKISGILRQVYAPHCLVDIVPDTGNDHTYRIKFYGRTSAQISSQKTNGVYTLTGDPTFEYIVDAPNHPTLDAIRITKITRQGGATHTMWTLLVACLTSF